MKKKVSFGVSCLFVFVSYGQQLSVANLFNLTSFSPSKFDNYLSRNGFAFTRNDVHDDTLFKIYTYRQTKNFKDIDSVTRSITRADLKDQSFIIYETASLTEFTNMKAQLNTAGFYCSQEDKSDYLSSPLYQNKDLWVRTLVRTEDSIKKYSLLCHKKNFPGAKDIYFADDLLTFTSHEYLVYYFGEKNVKKDIYFFSGDKIAKCSVLFLNTNRQVVFIWADEENRRTISSLVFGGQQNLKSSMESGKYVEENNWVLKSGVRPGMSLLELRLLNGNDLKFYGGNSANSGCIIPDPKGKLDFKKEEILLACLNCRDDKFSTTEVMNADDLIQDGRILFVLSIMLNAL